jgi:1,4-dihydroxy-2-naphthoate octaprenyltransferase
MSSHRIGDCIFSLVMLAMTGYAVYTEHDQLNWRVLFMALYCMVAEALILVYSVCCLWKDRRDKLAHRAD